MPADDLFAERLRKVEELAELGARPYNTDFHPDMPLAAARASLAAAEAAATVRGRPAEEAETSPVALAGRVMRERLQGRSCFVDIEDEAARLQVWLREDRLGPAAFERVRLLDLGDIVGVRGPLIRTRRGEPTLLADDLAVLVKSLRPIPEKYHGLQDPELRARKRHLDLLSSASRRRHFAARSAILRSVRSTLDSRGFLEVETPVLQPLAGGAAAIPFTTHWNALHADVQLRISLELHLKRLLVGGYSRVYEIGRVFRNEGLSPRHNPEFTMVEAYEAYGDLASMRALCEAILGAAAAVSRGLDGGEPLVDLRPPFRTARMIDLVAGACGIDPVRAWDEGRLAEEAARLGVPVPPDAGPGAILLELYEQRVEPELHEPTLVLDHPAEVTPLARRRPDDPRFVERFELIAAGRELANAFSELNDPIDQRRRFEEQARLRAAGHGEANPLDEDFLEAIEVGMPPAGGLGIGIDRLVMLLTGASSIRDVLLFPTLRPR